MKSTLFIIFSILLLTTSYAQTFDTTGLAASWPKLTNSYTSWDVGAFDTHRDPNNPSDFGWGEYSLATHIIEGDSIYIIKTIGGAYKAISIDQLASGVFTITYSNLDGTGRATKTLDRTNYSNRNFMYFSLDSETAKNLEANTTDWDILFTKYLTFFPGFGGYPVSGTLTNRGVWTSQVEFAQGGSYSVSDTNAFPMSDNISTIGYDWKDAFAGITHDTLVYYVRDQMGNVNELKFTDYSGSATGVFKFTVNGQADSVVLGAGNKDQVYYSLQNKSQLAINQDLAWDIALFAQSSFTSIPVRINDVNGSELYIYPKKDIQHWNSIGLDEENPINIVSVYPNPASDKITIALNSVIDRDIAYSITDQNGRLIHGDSFEATSGLEDYVIDLSKLSMGFYLLNLQSDSFFSSIKLVIAP